MTEDEYFLPAGYVSRPDPGYFVDDDLNAIWQPDLYPEAATVARRLGARKIIDVVCGTAAKLAAFHPRFEIVRIDYDLSIEACRTRYDFGTWIEMDLDTDDAHGFDDVAGAVLICGDVIEHLVYPERLLRMLKHALDGGAAALLLSTPERNLTYGRGHLGPPANPAHVREWAGDELQRFMASEGLIGFFGLTRSNDVVPYMRTILAAIPGSAPVHHAVMSDWFEGRQGWMPVDQGQSRKIAELERWSRELLAARDWAEEQRAAWQREAEAAAVRIAELGAQPQHLAELRTQPEGPRRVLKQIAGRLRGRV